MRTVIQWREDYHKYSNLYKEFKNSDMTLEDYSRQVDDIFQENTENSQRYRNIFAFRTGLKHHNAPVEYIKETVRHEGCHARIGRMIVNKFDPAFNLEIEYILEPVLFPGIFGDVLGIAPSVDFPNLYNVPKFSKEKYIYFMEKMFNEHPNPSEGDKLFMS